MPSSTPSAVQDGYAELPFGKQNRITFSSPLLPASCRRISLLSKPTSWHLTLASARADPPSRK